MFKIPLFEAGVENFLYLGSVDFALEEKATSEGEGGNGEEGEEGTSSLRVRLSVSGYICVGYAGEPAFTGSFTMQRPSLSPLDQNDQKGKGIANE